jgi:dTDP-4-dehydrorhamnose 3,5-epimerase
LFEVPNIKIEKTPLEGLLLIEPRCFRDERGFFIESFQYARYKAAGIVDSFVQDNQSRSVKDVLRGLHFQIRRPQAQIVTVMQGSIVDVAVDLRPNSSTFGRWFGAKLSEDGPRQMYMTSGFAHGFCVLSDVADVHYKVSRNYDHADEGGVLWNDPDIGINWPVDVPHLSARDSAYPMLHELGREHLPHVAIGNHT